MIAKKGLLNQKEIIKRAAIDIGSNSILLLVCEIEIVSNHKSKIEKILVNESRITSLGKGLLKTQSFSEEAMNDSFNALKEYCKIIEAENVADSEIIVTATEASRVANNAKMFFDKIRDELQLHVTIISGDGEAYYTAQGVLTNESVLKQFRKNKNSAIVIMDVGGSSTELIFAPQSADIAKKKYLESISLPIGAVKALDLINMGQFEKFMHELLSSNLYSFEKFENDTVICVAGSMTSVTAMLLNLQIYRDDKVDGQSIMIDELREFYNKISNYDVQTLGNRWQFLGKRVVSIRAGVLVALQVLQKLRTKHILISTRGLRYGTIIEGCIQENYRITKK